MTMALEKYQMEQEKIADARMVDLKRVRQKSKKELKRER